MKQVGMIGIGLMGHGIAASITRHGHPLTVLEHAGNQPLDRLRAAGVTTASTVRELTARSDVLILCVTGSPQVEALVRGGEGILAALRPGATVIDCSTAMPSSTLAISAAIAAAGGRFLDAPMTRTPREAAEGRLNLIVGGERALFDEHLPLLRCFADSIVYGGPVGSGHRLKLLHNYVSLGFAMVLSEAIACADKAGVDKAVMMEVLAKGAGAGVVFERFRPYVESGDGSGLQFSLTNALKDMTYYTDMAADIGAVSDAAQAVRKNYQAAASEGDPHRSTLQMIDWLSSTAPASKPDA